MDKDLAEALEALAEMWSQYCPPPMGHAFMSAGENAEEVLMKYNLLQDGDIDWDILNSWRVRL